jgi:hypothetical protein
MAANSVRSGAKFLIDMVIFPLNRFTGSMTLLPDRDPGREAILLQKEIRDCRPLIPFPQTWTFPNQIRYTSKIRRCGKIRTK